MKETGNRLQRNCFFDRPFVWIMGMMFLFTILPDFARGNNIRIRDKVKVEACPGDNTSVLLNFPLEWDNSWRDDFNWDGAWIFVKYKKAGTDWQHVNLAAAGHTLTSGFEYMTGTTGSDIVGLFIFRDMNNTTAGNVSLTCQIKCPLSALGGSTIDDFANHKAFVFVQGIEMVYVPYGAYSLGDGVCTNGFSQQTNVLAQRVVDSEAAQDVCVYGGGTMSLNDTYPKGFAGAFVMKYELSQEQYVMFLNTLTYAQQQALIPGLASMKSGDYIFGSRTSASDRNGIIYNEYSLGNNAVIFSCSLQGPEDGKTVACNYLSVRDMLAYCSWSGLRPMSELEYEKICRPLFPDEAQGGGYAWNSPVISGRLTGVSSVGGSENEVPSSSSANVNAGNTFGPVRCGAFAAIASGQRGAGATFWGVMEMSGNLKELCAGVNYSGFSRDIYGKGLYNPGLWDTVTVANYGVRGGGFNSPDNLLRTSDRGEMSGYITSMSRRDSTVGFRAVRPLTGVTITQPDLAVYVGNTTTSCTYSCTNQTSRIVGVTPTASVSGMTFTYLWHVYDPNTSKWTLLENQNDTALVYDRFVNTTTSNVTYKFRRTAICAAGSAMKEVSVLVPNVNFSLTPDTVFVTLGNAASSMVTATAIQTAGKYEWWYSGAKLVDAENIDYKVNETVQNAPQVAVAAGTSLYRANRVKLDPSNVTPGSWYTVEPRYTITVGNGSCMRKDTVSVWLDPYNADPCWGETTAPVDEAGNRVGVKAMGRACWMTANVNFGTYKAISANEATTGDYWLFDKPGVQKWCNGSTSNWDNPQYTNDANSCKTYGGLYEWWEVVCNGYCNTPGLTAATAQSISISQGKYTSMEEALKARISGVKMAANTGKYEHRRFVQGICPDGWHVPSDEEWKQLEMAHGMKRNMADRQWVSPGNTELTWGRMTNYEGNKMKSATGWTGTTTSGSLAGNANYRGSNTLGFNALPHGYRRESGMGFVHRGVEGLFGSSTLTGVTVWIWDFNSYYRSINRTTVLPSYGFGVRCVRN